MPDPHDTPAIPGASGTLAIPALGTPDAPHAPLRVLYVARAPFVSGAERALLSMLRHLDRSKIQPALVLGCETEMIAAAQDLNVPVSIVPLPKRSARRPMNWWRSVRGLGRCIDRFDPHLMHANDVPSCQAISVLGARRGIPRVLHVRWGITAQDAGWWARGGVDLVLCISEWVNGQLGDRAGTTLEQAEVQVLPDAVDWPADAIDQPHSATHTHDGSGAAGPASADMDREQDHATITLGFAGQLIESKGLDLVIQAIGRVEPAKRPRLLVAGRDTQTGGDYQAELESLAGRCGVADRITWLGFVDDVADLYRRVDAVVCPSRLEPLGLVPLEAARFGVPAIANRVGGLAETVEHGRTGYLVEPTVEAWAQAIQQLRGPVPLRPLGAAARTKTFEEYSPGVYQQRLMFHYERLAGQTTGRPAEQQPQPQKIG